MVGGKSNCPTTNANGCLLILDRISLRRMPHLRSVKSGAMFNVVRHTMLNKRLFRSAQEGWPVKDGDKEHSIHWGSFRQRWHTTTSFSPSLPRRKDSLGA